MQGMDLNLVTVNHDQIDAALHDAGLTKEVAALKGKIIELEKLKRDLEGQLSRQKELTLVRVKERDVAQNELISAKA
jgi:hypothetical protein